MPGINYNFSSTTIISFFYKPRFYETVASLQSVLLVGWAAPVLFTSCYESISTRMLRVLSKAEHKGGA